MKIRGKCPLCKNVKWFLKKRDIFLEVLKQTATSKQEICKGCAKKVEKIGKNA